MKISEIIQLSSVVVSCVFSLHSVDYSPYAEFCLRAAHDDATFANFKRDPLYNGTLEHVSPELGFDYLRFIVDYHPDLVVDVERFQENDQIGNPVCCRYCYGGFWSFSPTTLRYMKVAGDLRERFGDLRRMHILEIGGGYGGQCKIISSMGGFASYTIVDLPHVNALSKKYLSRCGVSGVTLIDNANLSDLRPSYDLLISNYAFLEFDRADQEKYCDVFQSANAGYITGYFPSDTVNFMSEKEFFEMANRHGIEMSKEVECPLSAPMNCLITWRR